ncbi:MAG TPA: hypothetical protein VGD77_04520 [Gemmatimonadaceae bacterium]
MPRRNFTDPNGVQWRVWNTVPSPRTLLSTDFAGGWLTFECEGCLKRLAPIPDDWESAEPARLLMLCEEAREVPRHTPVSYLQASGGNKDQGSEPSPRH